MNPKIYTSISILGAACAAAGQVGAANFAWSVSNPLLVAHNWRAGQKEQATMFSIFAVLAILGVLREVIF